MIDVVSACIIRGARVLLAQRPGDKKSYPFVWETPGGKVEPGESLVAALRRELHEELGLLPRDVYVPEVAIFSGTFTNDLGDAVSFHLFEVAVWKHAKLHNREGQGLGWFVGETLAPGMLGVRLTPGTAAAVTTIWERCLAAHARERGL
jgi:8-oxo-dGTP diphosphatase